MDVVVSDTLETLASYAADVITEFVRTNPRPVLGLATGGTMTPIYTELIDRYNRGQVSFLHTTGFLLDEYVGLPPSHPQTYRNVIRRVFADHVDLVPGSIHGPNGGADDLEVECHRYDQQVAQAGVGLQLLGIGRNGHIAFNEPGGLLESRSRVVELTEVTRADNARFFRAPDQAPKHAVTQGIGTIDEAARLLVVAAGRSKADAVRAAIEGPISPATPASALQLREDVTVLVDREAASLLGGSRLETSAGRRA